METQIIDPEKATPIEAEAPIEKPKYKRAMTEARKQAIQKMLDGKKAKGKTGKKSKAEQNTDEIKNQIIELTTKIDSLQGALQKKENVEDNELHITRPQKVEKDTKNKKVEYVSNETKQILLQNDGVMPAPPRPEKTYFGW